MSGLLNRINSAVAGGEQRADVAPIVAAHQARIPLAYTSQGVLPDLSSLAAFMTEQAQAVNGLVIYKAP